MRYHSFLHYGWFIHYLGKDIIPTNVHMTVGVDRLVKLAYIDKNVNNHKVAYSSILVV